MNQAASQSSENCLRPVGHVQLLEDHADVAFHGSFGDPQQGCDGFIAASLRNQLQHLPLTIAQHGMRIPCAELLRNLCRYVLFAFVHLP